MKIQHFKKRLPSHGDERTVSWFAWFPVHIRMADSRSDLQSEERWLERVTVRQEYDRLDTGFVSTVKWILSGGTYEGGVWKNKGFVDEMIETIEKLKEL